MTELTRGPPVRNHGLANGRLYEGIGTWIYERLGQPVIAEHHRRLRDRLAAELPPRARLLDIGSGPGELFLLLAAKRPDLVLVGIDAARTAVKRSRQRARQAGLAKAFFFHAQAECLPFADGQFDAAVSTGAFKHWSSHAAGLAEVVRVLAPGGNFWLYELDPQADGGQMIDLDRRLAMIGRLVMRRLVLPFSFSRERVRALIADHGSTLVSERLTPGLPFYEFVLRKPARPLVGAPLA